MAGLCLFGLPLSKGKEKTLCKNLYWRCPPVQDLNITIGFHWKRFVRSTTEEVFMQYRCQTSAFNARMQHLDVMAFVNVSRGRILSSFALE